MLFMKHFIILLLLQSRTRRLAQGSPSNCFSFGGNLIFSVNIAEIFKPAVRRFNNLFKVTDWAGLASRTANYNQKKSKEI